MKKSNKTLYVKISLILVIVSLFSCTRCLYLVENLFNDVIKSDEVFIKYIINFGGDWTHFEKVEQIDKFRIYSTDKNSNTILERTYNLLFENNKPKLENDDLTKNYIKSTSQDSPCQISVETNISSSITNKSNTFYEKQYVRTGSKNDITLNYDANQEPSIKFKTTIDSKKGIIFTSDLYNYNCNYEVLNQSKNTIDKSVNIV
ncbi:MAG TPA: hypothetical protein PK771_12625, partial [Spirochaetota bacterium]|nr:hypothetical protein [Spirochaetota bacterium]